MNRHLVSVLMPVYNGALYLHEAMDSMLCQSFKDFEFFIINDGSTDVSEEIILSYRDTRIRYIKNEVNLGLVQTLNKGIQSCQGKYIVRMDADDISHPERIQKQLEFMESNPNIGVCGSWFETLGNSSSTLAQYKETHDAILTKMLYQCHFCHPSLIIRSEVFLDKEMLFNEDYIHAEDYDFYIKLASKWQLHNLQFPYLKYRIHSESVSNTFRSIQRKNSLRIRQRLFESFNTKVTESELEAFEALNHQDYRNIKLEVEKMQCLLESLLLGNREHCRIGIFYFDNYLQDLWLHFCYQTASKKDYVKSQLLASSAKAEELGSIKWAIKSWLKN